MKIQLTISQTNNTFVLMAGYETRNPGKRKADGRQCGEPFQAGLFVAGNLFLTV
jgi:hypothetical protein